MKNKKNRFFELLILISFFCFSCTKYKSSDIILQIGQYKLSVSEYEKFKNTNNEKLSIKQLGEKLINDGYILAYSIDNSYDTINILSKKLEYAVYNYASKVDGFVWNKIVKPNLTIKPDIIKDANNKRSFEYSLEILYYPNKESVSRFINPNVKIESEKDFYLLKESASIAKEVGFFQIRDRYPFHPLGAYTNNIINLKKGAVFGPLETLSGYYVVHIAGVEKTKEQSYDETKSEIEKILTQTLTEKYIWESQTEIFSKANVKYNQDAISEFASNYNEAKREWTGKNTNTELMKYVFQKSVRSYTVADLLEYIRCAPITYGSMSDKNVIKECLQNYIQYVYLYDEAKALQINTDEDFLLFKKQYQEKLFIQYYNEQKIAPNAIASDSECKAYYNENIDKFKKFESAIVSVFKFNNYPSASAARPYITNQFKEKTININSKLTEIAGLISVKKNLEIHLSDTAHNGIVIHTISDLNEGDLSFPLTINEEFWDVYLTSKRGNDLMPFKYAQIEIKEILFSEKYRKIHELLVAELKTKYALKINHLEDYNHEARKSR